MYFMQVSSNSLGMISVGDWTGQTRGNDDCCLPTLGPLIMQYEMVPEETGKKTLSPVRYEGN